MNLQVIVTAKRWQSELPENRNRVDPFSYYLVNTPPTW